MNIFLLWFWHCHLLPLNLFRKFYSGVPQYLTIFPVSGCPCPNLLKCVAGFKIQNKLKLPDDRYNIRYTVFVLLLFKHNLKKGWESITFCLIKAELGLGNLKTQHPLWAQKIFPKLSSHLDLLLCELGLCCQAADFSHGGVRKFLVCAAQQGVGVHSCTVGGDAAEWNEQLRLSCCCSVLGLESRKHLKQRKKRRDKKRMDLWCHMVTHRSNSSSKLLSVSEQDSDYPSAAGLLFCSEEYIQLLC